MRAVLGWPLGDTSLTCGSSIMLNLLGEADDDAGVRIGEVCSVVVSLVCPVVFGLLCPRCSGVCVCCGAGCLGKRWSERSALLCGVVWVCTVSSGIDAMPSFLLGFVRGSAASMMMALLPFFP